ncbi:MAG: transposase [Polaromonas sp.]|nr:transposase [Polaromonas sp.]MDP2819598.1 transposase [Polaromonas sp.]
MGQPEADRCALACAFLAKAVLDLKSTRALIERLQADSKLRRLCGFDLRHALPSEATFNRAFDEFARDELMQRVHARMIEDTLADRLLAHISRDSTAIEARESIAKKTMLKSSQPSRKANAVARKKVKFAPAQSQVHWGASAARRLSKCFLNSILLGAIGTKKNAQGYKISWKGYKLHLDTACCGVPISAQRVDACYELMDAAYCSAVIREEIQAAGRVPLIDHKPAQREKKAEVCPSRGTALQNPLRCSAL